MLQRSEIQLGITVPAADDVELLLMDLADHWHTQRPTGTMDVGIWEIRVQAASQPVHWLERVVARGSSVYGGMVWGSSGDRTQGQTTAEQVVLVAKPHAGPLGWLRRWIQDRVHGSTDLCSSRCPHFRTGAEAWGRSGAVGAHAHRLRQWRPRIRLVAGLRTEGGPDGNGEDRDVRERELRSAAPEDREASVARDERNGVSGIGLVTRVAAL